jgi:hypothetical protein
VATTAKVMPAKISQISIVYSFFQSVGIIRFIPPALSRRIVAWQHWGVGKL